MDKRITFLVKGIKNPVKAIRYIPTLIDTKLGLTEYARVSGRGERLVIKDWHSAKIKGDFTTLTHVQRYEWFSRYVNNLFCLDAGCGSGYGTYLLAKNVKSIIGVDISIEAINFARKYYKAKNLCYLQMDVCNLKFEDNYFDACISFEVIEHLESKDQDKFLSEVCRVLKPEGRLYISCPNATVSLKNNTFHRRELTLTEFECLLRKYFKECKVFCQDLLKNGVRQKENWHRCIQRGLRYQDLIITEEDCNCAFGLLAICKKPKK